MDQESLKNVKKRYPGADLSVEALCGKLHEYALMISKWRRAYKTLEQICIAAQGELKLNKKERNWYKYCLLVNFLVSKKKHHFIMD